MALFKKLFASADPLASVRKAFARNHWADVLALGRCLDPASLSEEAVAELTGLLRQAGDRLATINLDEAEAFIRSGDERLAREHLALAESLSEDAALRGRVDELRARLKPSARPAAPAAAPDPAPAASAPGSCAGCGPAALVPAAEERPALPEDADLDLDTRLELCLGGYPEGLVERYLGFGPELKQAVVLAHGGEQQAAVDAFAAVPDAERSTDFFYERGVLLGRAGELEGAVADLERCLELDPAHPMAGVVLFDLLLASERLDQAGVLLERLAATGHAPAFCLGRKALLAVVSEDYAGGLEAAEKAFEAGNREPELLVLYGQLLERNGRLEKAEEVYGMSGGTGGGGCCGEGGGMPVALAEFLLRQKRKLGRVVETFKGLWNQDPANPLWMLRTGQAYLAMGSSEHGRKLVNAVLAHPDAPQELREEAHQALEADC